MLSFWDVVQLLLQAAPQANVPQPTARTRRFTFARTEVLRGSASTRILRIHGATFHNFWKSSAAAGAMRRTAARHNLVTAATSRVPFSGARAAGSATTTLVTTTTCVSTVTPLGDATPGRTTGPVRCTIPIVFSCCNTHSCKNTCGIPCVDAQCAAGKACNDTNPFYCGSGPLKGQCLSVAESVNCTSCCDTTTCNRQNFTCSQSCTQQQCQTGTRCLDGTPYMCTEGLARGGCSSVPK